MTGTLHLASNGLVAGTDQLVISSGNVGIGTASPAQKLDVSGNVRATSFIATSDERLKTNIETVKGLEDVLKLRGVRFDWKSDGVTELGFIAQEIEKVYPELVVTDPVTGYKSVRYQGIIAPLVEAVKELHKRSEADRELIKYLLEQLVKAQTDIEDLRRRMDVIEAENAALKEQSSSSGFEQAATGVR